LAKTHAAAWESPLLEAGGMLADITHWDALPDLPHGQYAWGQVEPERSADYTALPRAQGVPMQFRDRDWMIRALSQLSEFGRTGPCCFLHGDFHLGNLYFEADGTPGALEWQTFVKGHWAHDVTYFMVSALDIADRRRWDLALLAYYLERLAIHGVEDPPSFAEAMTAYRLNLADGLFYWMTNLTEWQSEVNNAAVTPRFAMAALDHGLGDVMARA
jgi:aminoglycoside phosphotransferase (APT) family kinase protein